MVELIWHGKYDKDGNKREPVRVALPFQTVETVNESVQDRRRSLELFGSGRDPAWRNRLIWGDTKYLLPSLLPEFAGKVDLVYIDPPFATGADFSHIARLPGPPGAPENGTGFGKEPSILEEKAYRDTWGGGLRTYLDWFFGCASLLRDLLADGGSLYVHLDWRVVHHVKVLLDEVFGPENFRNDITWRRASNLGRKAASGQYGRVTDTILFYSKGDPLIFSRPYLQRRIDAEALQAYKFDERAGKYFKTSPRGDYTDESIARLEEQGRVHRTANGNLRIKYFLDKLPDGAWAERVPVDCLWLDIPDMMHTANAERLGYPTQKPESLLKRVICASSAPGGLVLDCFVGSGTTAAVAEELGRRWIACDLSRFAIHTTRKRLLGIPNVRPFVVQNLGKYERQAWQVAEFPANGDDRLEEQKKRESAYRQFILELYHATPVAGHSWLHGIRAARMVHVGAVDAPVTLADVKAIAKEVWKTAGTAKSAPETAAVDILGWEFAFDLNETAKQIAAEARVDVRFKKIPRDVLDKRAVEAGDIQFFELGALSVEPRVSGRELKLKLTDFVIPLDDVPEQARKAIKHWSQMIDYWAVDWDFKGDTFHNQWQSYRTRKDPSLELAASYNYPEPGKYTVVVKVVDILGNDTTKALAVKIGAPRAKARGA